MKKASMGYEIAVCDANHNAKPDVQDKLGLMHLIERLKLQKRTGWVRQGINLPESIADHMYRMAMLSLLSEEDEQLDIAKCVQMAVVHDLAEATVGDITPYDGISKAEKEKLESVSRQWRREMISKTDHATPGCYGAYNNQATGSKQACIKTDTSALSRV